MSASQPALFNVQEFTDNGVTLVGGRLYTYEFGTTAQKVAYTDPEGNVPQTYTADGLGGQYIALNARGELPTPLYLGPEPYDLSLKRQDGSTVWVRKAEGVDAGLLKLSDSNGAALVKSAAWYADTVMSFNAAKLPNGATVIFAGRSAADDGGGGAFTYVKNSTQTANNVLVFAPTGGGRLMRNGWTVFGFNGPISPKWAGVRGDNVADDTSAWALVISVSISAGATIEVPGGSVSRITSSLDLPATLRIIGVGGSVQGAPKFMSVGGAGIFRSREGFASESVCFENLAFDSDTPGKGSGFIGSTTSYLSQATFKNCIFWSNLEYGIQAPIILCSFFDCDFGSYPGVTQNFKAIYSSGTSGSYEPNANCFWKCVFRKSNALYQILAGASGTQWNFYNCDFEQNACTQTIVYYDGQGSVNFFGGYIEHNVTPYFLRAYGNLAIAFCQVVSLQGMHFNNPAQIAILKRELAYPLFEIINCYGQLNCNLTQNDDGLLNQPSDFTNCYGNHFVAGTGSYGAMDTVTGPGYNARRVQAVTMRADVATFKQTNAVQKIGAIVTAATNIAILSNSIDPLGANFAGSLDIMAISGASLTTPGAANTASYQLSVSNGGITVCILVSSSGVTSGSAANHPSFTWSIAGGGALIATPIGATSGQFSFIISATGCLAAT